MKELWTAAMRGVATRSIVLAAALGCTLVAFACAGNDDTPGVADGGTGNDAGPLVVGPGDGGGSDGAPILDPTRKMCIATECPAPYATCAVNGILPEFRCGTDLSTDLGHCGACNNACGTIPTELGMYMACVHGECEAVCRQYRQ